MTYIYDRPNVTQSYNNLYWSDLEVKAKVTSLLLPAELVVTHFLGEVYMPVHNLLFRVSLDWILHPLLDMMTSHYLQFTSLLASSVQYSPVALLKNVSIS